MSDPERTVTPVAEGWIIYLDTELIPEPYPEGVSPSVVGLLGKWNGAAHLGSIAVSAPDCGSQPQAMIQALEKLAGELRQYGWPPLGRALQRPPELNPDSAHDAPETERTT
jgi:hypothetical protein